MTKLITRRTIFRGAVAATLASPLAGAFMSESAAAATPDLANTIYLTLPFGRVTIALRPDLAPDLRANQDVDQPWVLQWL